MLNSKSNKSITLDQMQRAMAEAIMHPSIQSTNFNSAVYLIKPNQQLKAAERLSIYHEQYWLRLLDSLHDDFPGLNAVLGEERFQQLCTAYLVAYPSRTHMLNYLGEHLAKFVLESPHLSNPHNALAYQLACLEWAEMLAHSAPEHASLNRQALLNGDAVNKTLKLQPHITVLQLDYALDNFLLKLNKNVDKSIESNAFIRKIKKSTPISLPKKQRIFLAIYRMNDIIYYKRLNKNQYLLLSAINEGKTIVQACTDLITKKTSILDINVLAEKLKRYFASWMELNWFCA